jgi:hypothetical protein
MVAEWNLNISILRYVSDFGKDNFDIDGKQLIKSPYSLTIVNCASSLHRF